MATKQEKFTKEGTNPGKEDGNFDKGKKFPKGRKSPKGKGKQSAREWDRDRSGSDKFTGKTNDPAWYFKYKELADNAARIAFNHRVGRPISVHVANNRVTTNLDPLLCYRWIPTPGLSVDGNSAINLTSKSAWKMLNRRFRGVSKYQQSDFGIIQFGVLDFMASLAEAERVYGLMTLYKLNNTQVPTALLINMGYDPDSFTNLADFRIRLNRLIVGAKTLCLVKGYSLLDHYLLLANNVFRDRNSERSQLYTFRKAGYWKYDPTAPTGSSLVFYRYSARTALINSSSVVQWALSTAEDILHDLNEQLSALLDDDDVDNVCSDILAFYGNKDDNAEIVRLGLIPEDYVVEPVWSDMVNRQVHNMTTYGSFQDTNADITGNDGQLVNYSSVIPSNFTQQGFNSLPPVMIYQENNVIKFNLHFFEGQVHVVTEGNYVHSYGETVMKAAIIKETIVDTDILSPSPEEVMEMTRLCTYSDEVSTTDSGTNIYDYPCTAVSSVCVLGMQLFQFVLNQNYTYTAVSAMTYEHTLHPSSYGIGGIQTHEPFSDKLSIIVKYDWAPILYYFHGSSGNTFVTGELDNYKSFDADLIDELHDIALLSEFKNPIVDFILKE